MRGAADLTGLGFSSGAGAALTAGKALGGGAAFLKGLSAEPTFFRPPPMEVRGLPASAGAASITMQAMGRNREARKVGVFMVLGGTGCRGSVPPASFLLNPFAAGCIPFFCPETGIRCPVPLNPGIAARLLLLAAAGILMAGIDGGIVGRAGGLGLAGVGTAAAARI